MNNTILPLFSGVHSLYIFSMLILVMINDGCNQPAQETPLEVTEQEPATTSIQDDQKVDNMSDALPGPEKENHAPDEVKSARTDQPEIKLPRNEKTTPKSDETNSTVSLPAKPDKLPETTVIQSPVQTKLPVSEKEKTTETSVNSNVPEWVVPDKFKNLQNPISMEKTDMALGKTLYSKHCKSCHGNNGLGDGTKASTLETPMRSFKLSSFKSQKPGEIYYKAMIGRDDMPSFEKKLTDDEERWTVVNYILSF